MPATRVVEVIAGQPVEGTIFKVVEVAPPRDGHGLEPSAADQFGIEYGRQLRDGTDHFALMVEEQSEVRFQEAEARLRVLVVGKQCMANLNLGNAGRVPVAFYPRLEVAEGRVVVARVEGVEGVVVVVIFGAGDELLEGRRAVLGQGEVFDVADVGGSGVGRSEVQHCEECREQARGEPRRRAFHVRPS